MHRVMSFLVNKSTKDTLESITLFAVFIAVWFMIFGLGIAFSGGLVIGITLITLSVICLATAGLASYVKHELVAYYQYKRDLHSNSVPMTTRKLMTEAGIISSSYDYGGILIFHDSYDVTYNGSRHMRKFEKIEQKTLKKLSKFPNVTAAERSTLNSYLLSAAELTKERILCDEPELGGPGRYEAFNKLLVSIASASIATR